MDTRKSRLEQLIDKIFAFDRLYADQMRHLDDPCEHDVPLAFMEPHRCALCSIEYVRYCIDNDLPYDRTNHAYLLAESIIEKS